MLDSGLETAHSLLHHCWFYLPSSARVFPAIHLSRGTCSDRRRATANVTNLSRHLAFEATESRRISPQTGLDHFHRHAGG